MPAAWGVAVSMLSADFFADDDVLACLEADSVLCAKHYRYVSRALCRAAIPPADDSMPPAVDAPT